MTRCVTHRALRLPWGGEGIIDFAHFTTLPALSISQLYKYAPARSPTFLPFTIAALYRIYHFANTAALGLLQVLPFFRFYRFNATNAFGILPF